MKHSAPPPLPTWRVCDSWLPLTTPDFLSWLRLSIYMCVVAVAIILSFQLKTEPSVAERRMALPLGVIFWSLSLVCLGAGLSNYLAT